MLNLSSPVVSFFKDKGSGKAGVLPIVWCLPVLPALGRWWPEDQEFRMFLGYMSLRPAWAT